MDCEGRSFAKGKVWRRIFENTFYMDHVSRTGTTKHAFHLVNESYWPILISFSALILFSSLAFYVHKIPYSGYLLIYAILLVGYCAYEWLNDIIDEATFSGYHTIVVRNGLKLGFFLFILSEIMLFFGFFWAFFHSSICPIIEIGCIYPPSGIHTIAVCDFPLYNTFILIVSGISLTWAHYSLSVNRMKDTIDAFLITIFLGFFFVILQMFEYYESTFSFSDSVYSCSFYMLTGLHGCHVIAGVSFLSVCLLRLLRRDYLLNHYLGLVFAIWYWHFVDIVWIFLFLTVYCWGSW